MCEIVRCGKLVPGLPVQKCVLILQWLETEVWVSLDQVGILTPKQKDWNIICIIDVPPKQRTAPVSVLALEFRAELTFAAPALWHVTLRQSGTGTFPFEKEGGLGLVQPANTMTLLIYNTHTLLNQTHVHTTHFHHLLQWATANVARFGKLYEPFSQMQVGSRPNIAKSQHQKKHRLLGASHKHIWVAHTWFWTKLGLSKTFGPGRAKGHVFVSQVSQFQLNVHPATCQSTWQEETTNRTFWLIHHIEMSSQGVWAGEPSTGKCHTLVSYNLYIPKMWMLCNRSECPKGKHSPSGWDPASTVI